MVKRRDMWYGHPSHHGNPNVTAFSKHKDVLYTTYTLYIYIYTLYKHIRYIHGVMAIPQAVHPSSSPLKAQVHHAVGRPARRSIEGLRLLLKASRDGRRADLGDSCWYMLTKNSQKHPPNQIWGNLWCFPQDSGYQWVDGEVVRRSYAMVYWQRLPSTQSNNFTAKSSRLPPELHLYPAYILGWSCHHICRLTLSQAPNQSNTTKLYMFE